MKKSEIPKRLEPSFQTKRELYLKSGNVCAFPNCDALMMNADSVFIGQICHIEAAEPDGERFNADMTNEERRAPANLMLLCYPHHQITNDVDKYAVEVLRKMKADHEHRFAASDRTTARRFRDWTRLDTPVGVSNLKRLDRILELGQVDGDLETMVEELNQEISSIARAPRELRQFVGALARRMVLMQDSPGAYIGMTGSTILIEDLKTALRLSDQEVRRNLSMLEAHSLGGFDELDTTSMGPQAGITLAALSSGWQPWLDIVEFCERTGTALERFTDDLDFSALDD